MTAPWHGAVRELHAALSRDAEGTTMSTAKFVSEAQPILGQRSQETQAFGTLTRYPPSRGDGARRASVDGLSQILADTITLRVM